MREPSSPAALASLERADSGNVDEMRTWLANASSRNLGALLAAEAGLSAPLTQLLYGGGPALTNSAGVPWTAAYVDSIGDPTCDLRSNIAAEARAKIIYERLINMTPDPGVQQALGFLMTREIAHQKSFEKALYRWRSWH